MTITDTANPNTTWLSKPEAANVLGVTTKTLDNFVRAGKLRRRSATSSTGRTMAVYDSTEVAAVADERRNLMEARSAAPPMPMIRVNPDGAEDKSATMTVVRRSVATRQTPPPPPSVQALIAALKASEKPSEKLFLTIPEAAQLTGLSQALIRRWCQKRKLKAIMDGGWKIPRKALLAL